MPGSLRIARAECFPGEGATSDDLDLVDAARAALRTLPAHGVIDGPRHAGLELGGWANPVAGPYHNFSMPEPGGVCVALQADAGETPLLGFMSLVLPPLCAGNAVVAVADARHPLGALLVAESAPTADVPAGALNVLTGQAAELASWVAGHRDVDSVHAQAGGEVAATLRAGAAENLKRVTVLSADEDFGDEERWTNPRRLASFVETKTIWHPSSA